MTHTIERPKAMNAAFSPNAAYAAMLDEQAEREGIAMRRHRRLTAKHRRIVYRGAGVADPRP